MADTPPPSRPEDALPPELRPRPRVRLPPTPATLGIVVINALVFVGQLLLPGRPLGALRLGDPCAALAASDRVAEHMGLCAPLVWDGQVWRLVTAAFVHFGAMHIFFNMFVLWDIGRLCEIVVGRVRYLVTYLAAAIGGTVASTLFSGRPSGGASGALFGIAGALLALVVLDRERRVFAQRDRLKGMLLRFIAINGVIQFVIPHIDIAAHMGGLVTGAAVGAVIFGRSRVAGARAPAILWSGAAVLVLLAALAAWSVHPVGLPRFEAWRSSTDALIEELMGR